MGNPLPKASKWYGMRSENGTVAVLRRNRGYTLVWFDKPITNTDGKDYPANLYDKDGDTGEPWEYVRSIKDVQEGMSKAFGFRPVGSVVYTDYAEEGSNLERAYKHFSTSA